MISPKSFQTFIYEAINRTQQLDDLRKASANATLTGPSKEAQELMSDRTKAILGQNKLKAGIEAQQNVEKMKSEIDAPKSTPTATPTSVAPMPMPIPKPTTLPTSSGLNSQQQGIYNKAFSYYKNPSNQPFIDNYFNNKLSSDQKKQFCAHAKQRGDNWGNLCK